MDINYSIKVNFIWERELMKLGKTTPNIRRLVTVPCPADAKLSPKRLTIWKVKASVHVFVGKDDALKNYKKKSKKSTHWK